MHIFSLILSTITSAVNAVFTIIALSGGFTMSYADSSVGLIPRTIAPLIYSFILPTTLFFLVVSLATKPEKASSKVVNFLRLSFGLSFLQALVSVIIYQLNYNALTSPEIANFNLLPVIIEIGVIVVAFVLSVVLAIKATENRVKFDFSPRVLAFTALALGVFEFLLDVIPIVIFKLEPNNPFTQPLLQWTEYLRMLNPAIFGLAAVNSLRKPDKWMVMAWAGVLLAFLARVVLYTIAYI